MFKTIRQPFLIFYIFLAVFASEVSAVEKHSLLQAIDFALTGSDKAFELKDNLTLSRMDIGVSEHAFDTKLVPLTSIGFTRGTGSQQLGLEMRKNTHTGTSISYGFVGNRIDDSTGYAVENSTNAQAYVKLSQGLFRRWGERYNLTDLTNSELRAKETEIWVERERQSLILSTVQKYYDLALQTRLLIQTEESLERSRAHLNSATSRQQVGLVSKVDVYRAELAMLDAEIALENQLRARQRAEDIYKELIRLETGDQVAVDQQILKMAPVIPEGWEKAVWKTRLDWQAYRVKMKVNNNDIYRAEKDLTPDIGVSATVEQRGEGDSVEDALELNETNWALQLELFSSLDTFNEENALRRIQMERGKLRRDEEALKRRIGRESRDAFLDLLSAEKKHLISGKRLKQAEMALDLAKTRYEKGLSNNLDLLDAETAYSEAELDIARALTSYNLAAVTFSYNLGVLDRKWIQMSLESAREFANL